MKKRVKQQEVEGGKVRTCGRLKMFILAAICHRATHYPLVVGPFITGGCVTLVNTHTHWQVPINQLWCHQLSNFPRHVWCRTTIAFWSRRCNSVFIVGYLVSVFLRVDFVFVRNCVRIGDMGEKNHAISSSFSMMKNVNWLYLKIAEICNFFFCFRFCVWHHAVHPPHSVVSKEGLKIIFQHFRGKVQWSFLSDSCDCVKKGFGNHGLLPIHNYKNQSKKLFLGKVIVILCDCTYFKDMLLLIETVLDKATSSVDYPWTFLSFLCHLFNQANFSSEKCKQIRSLICSLFFFCFLTRSLSPYHCKSFNFSFFRLLLCSDL